jgi:hypothetical protein
VDLIVIKPADGIPARECGSSAGLAARALPAALGRRRLEGPGRVHATVHGRGKTSDERCEGATRVGLGRLENDRASRCAAREVIMPGDHDQGGADERRSVRNDRCTWLVERVGRNQHAEVANVLEAQGNIGWVEREAGNSGSKTLTGRAGGIAGSVIRREENPDRAHVVGIGNQRGGRLERRRPAGVAEHRTVPDANAGEGHQHGIAWGVVPDPSDELHLCARIRCRPCDGRREPSRLRRIAWRRSGDKGWRTDDGDHSGERSRAATGSAQSNVAGASCSRTISTSPMPARSRSGPTASASTTTTTASRSRWRWARAAARTSAAVTASMAGR